jgi:ribosomal protein uS3
MLTVIIDSISWSTWKHPGAPLRFQLLQICASVQYFEGISNSLSDGVFYAELNEFFQRELAEEGYSGVEVRVTPTVTDIIIRATHTQEVLGEQGRRIRELTSLIQKRFNFPENSVSLYAAKVQNRGLSAVAQCESLRYKLLNGLAVRRACYGVLRFIMESGAKGCEVVVSGKLRAARAKSMKFTVCLEPRERSMGRKTNIGCRTDS